MDMKLQMADAFTAYLRGITPIIKTDCDVESISITPEKISMVVSSPYGPVYVDIEDLLVKSLGGPVTRPMFIMSFGEHMDPIEVMEPRYAVGHLFNQILTRAMDDVSTKLYGEDVTRTFNEYWEK